MKNAQPHATTPSSIWARAKEVPHPLLPAPCWIWQGLLSPGGYGRVRFGGKQWRVHRLVVFLRTGRRPAVVQHDCDRRACINPAHLTLGSQRTNQADKVAKGRQARGEAVGNAKLTDDCVHAIRVVHAAGGAAYSDLAKWFRVNKSTIGNIVRRETWLPLHPDATEPDQGEVPF